MLMVMAFGQRRHRSVLILQYDRVLDSVQVFFSNSCMWSEIDCQSRWNYKNQSRWSPVGITRLAEWWQTVIARDGSIMVNGMDSYFFLTEASYISCFDLLSRVKARSVWLWVSNKVMGNRRNILSIGDCTWDLGTYRIVEQRRLWWVCAFAQTCQSLRCSHTQSMDVDWDWDQNLDI